MGQDLTKTVKKAAPGHHQEVYTSLGSNLLPHQQVCRPGGSPDSDRKLSNKIKGRVAHLMKWIQRGPVRGISIQLQKAGEGRENYMPEVSALD